MSTFPVVIHHNTDCGTSRNVLELIRAAGYEPTIVPYLETGWTRPQLLALFALVVGVIVFMVSEMNNRGKSVEDQLAELAVDDEPAVMP